MKITKLEYQDVIVRLANTLTEVTYFSPNRGLAYERLTENVNYVTLPEISKMLLGELFLNRKGNMNIENDQDIAYLYEYFEEYYSTGWVKFDN